VSKFKSKFEQHVAALFRRRKVKFVYEADTFPFVQPAIARKYTPDFYIPKTGIYVESKGKLTIEDRKKMLWVKETYPDLRLVMLFQRASNPIRKGSKTTYGDWATANGFDWADWADGIPERWTK
jgi:Autographiviridae endonuclease I